MKNVLKNSLYLSLFIVSGIAFQISCSNSDNASKTEISSQLNKLIYFKNTGSAAQLWTCNYDGTNQTEINIALPSNVYLYNSNLGATPRLSPDGQKVFFVGQNNNTLSLSIYSCDISGNNVNEIVTTPTGQISIGSAN